MSTVFEAKALSRLAALHVSLAALLLGSNGCAGKPAALQPFPVSGKVTINQRPLSFATLEFVPKPSGSARSVVVENGQFSLPKEHGLPEGQYNVRVRPYSPEIEEFQSFPAEKRQAVVAARKSIPQAYERDGVLTAQVSANAPNELTFDLKR